MDSKITGNHMLNSDTFITGISSISGGGKTAVAGRVAELLPDAVALHFDDYDFDTVHPESFLRWFEDGANYNDWETPKLKDDLCRLKTGQAIASPVDGVEVRPQKHVIIDFPFGYAHAETARLIDFTVFIDTPLDVAMARRLLRDYSSISADSSSRALRCLNAQLSDHLDYARPIYLEMDKQIKPYCDLVLDGCLPVDDLAREIVQIIAAKTA